MNVWIRNLSYCFMMIGVLVLVLPGCAPAESGKKSTSESKAKHKHGTKGPHGGPLAEWGEDDFHVEFTVDTKSKKAVIYILDEEAEKAPDVKVEKITDVKLFIHAAKIDKMELTHDAELSGEKGIAFVSSPHDAFAKEGEFKGTIDGKVNGTPYSGKFPLKPAKK